MANQTKTGRAFEYSIAKCYFDFLKLKKVSVTLKPSAQLKNAKIAYNGFPAGNKKRFNDAAKKTIETIVAIEPRLTTQSKKKETVSIDLPPDSQGQQGDVRDIIFRRINFKSTWELGISAKNNHDAVKHSRLSSDIDFGYEWMKIPCSTGYFREVNIVFNKVRKLMMKNKKMRWSHLGTTKENKYYLPILEAFRKELLRIDVNNHGVPKKLLSYLIGKNPFYKIIKDDKRNLVIIKAYNLGGQLNKPVGNVRPRARTHKIKLASRIIEFKLKNKSKTTLIMTLDNGWQISFRIHSAKGLLEPSLKFDITLIGNPPVLFTQHLFG
ncbi:MAG: HaeIII family restriction endonuclease [Bacteroidia bacterium]